jgi:hypothetical protein
METPPLTHDDLDDDDSSSSSLDNDGDSDDNGCEYQQMVREKITRNKAHLTKLGFDDDLETKKTNNRKSAPRSLAPEGPRRRNPVRSSRAMTIYESSVEGSVEGLLEGLVEGCVEGLVEGSLEGLVDGSLDRFVFNDGLLEGLLDGFVLNDGLLEGLVEESINTPPINADSINKQDFYAQHNNDCKVCNLGGDLLCCDKCTLVFHLQCVCPKLKEVPPGDWMCAYCCVAGLGGKKDGKERRKATQACREVERMSRECMKATVDQIKPSSEDSLFETSPMTAKTLPPTLPPTTTTVTGTTADCKSPPELEHPFKTIPANPELANKLVVIAKKLLETNTIKVVLDDAGYSYRLSTNDSALSSSWPHADNDHAVTSSDEVRPVANMTKDKILRAGLRREGERRRYCMTYAFLGVLSVALTADAKSAPPLIADLVLGHNQTKEFDKKSGSTGIDEGQEFAKPLTSESLRM